MDSSLDLSVKTGGGHHGKPLPDYCKIMRFKDANGQMKEMVFPRGLDLDRPKRPRTTFTNEQLAALELRFNTKQYLVGKERAALAKQLQLSETQIKVWFQNRRTKCKRDRPDREESDSGSSVDVDSTSPSWMQQSECVAPPAKPAADVVPESNQTSWPSHNLCHPCMPFSAYNGLAHGLPFWPTHTTTTSPYPTAWKV